MSWARNLVQAITVCFILLIFGFNGVSAEPSAIPELTSETENTGDVVISFERTGCFGTCPIYWVIIKGDGTVFYYGLNFVKVLGERTATIRLEQVKELVFEFERVNFFSLQDNYTKAYVTDLPSAITSINIHGRMKKVRHYLGDHSAPKGLLGLEFRIDEITNSKKWTGK